MGEMHVVSVGLQPPAAQPLLLLREVDGDRCLPLWIGVAEAEAIARQQQGVAPARPMTHDLLKSVIEGLGRRLEQVRITHLKHGMFFAELIFEGNVRVSARPSDSVALALRTGVAIYAEEDLLVEAGVVVGTQDADQVERFREFLDSVSPEDFGEAPS